MATPIAAETPIVLNTPMVAKLIARNVMPTVVAEAVITLPMEIIARVTASSTEAPSRM